jgi:hypothetical protein
VPPNRSRATTRSFHLCDETVALSREKGKGKEHTVLVFLNGLETPRSDIVGQTRDGKGRKRMQGNVFAKNSNRAPLTRSARVCCIRILLPIRWLDDWS